MQGVGYSLAFARDMVPERMKPYSGALPPIYAEYQGRYLVLGAPGRGVEQLAGDWGPRALMIGQFPSVEAVRGFWWSPAYRSAAELRRGAVVVDVCALAGTLPPAGHATVLAAAMPAATAATLRAALEGAGATPIAFAAAGDLEVLEGDLRGLAVGLWSFADTAAAREAWRVAAAAGPGTQAYVAPRMPA